MTIYSLLREPGLFHSWTVVVADIRPGGEALLFHGKTCICFILYISLYQKTNGDLNEKEHRDFWVFLRSVYKSSGSFGSNLRFDLKLPHLTSEFWDAWRGLSRCPTKKLTSKKFKNGHVWAGAKISILQDDFLDNNSIITFQDRSRDTQKSRSSFELKPPDLFQTTNSR